MEIDSCDGDLTEGISKGLADILSLSEERIKGLDFARDVIRTEKECFNRTFQKRSSSDKLKNGIENGNITIPGISVSATDDGSDLKQNGGTLSLKQDKGSKTSLGSSESSISSDVKTVEPLKKKTRKKSSDENESISTQSKSSNTRRNSQKGIKADSIPLGTGQTSSSGTNAAPSSGKSASWMRPLDDVMQEYLRDLKQRAPGSYALDLLKHRQAKDKEENEVNECEDEDKLIPNGY